VLPSCFPPWASLPRPPLFRCVVSIGGQEQACVSTTNNPTRGPDKSEFGRGTEARILLL